MYVNEGENALGNALGNISPANSGKIDKSALKKELKSYRAQGVRLCLNGMPSTPKTIAKACMVAEDCGYMRDYTEDENGRIAEVNFNYIKIR